MKRWKGSTEGMVAATSIFASFAGALVAFIVAFNEKSLLVQACILSLLIAFILFAYTAEMICDVFEQDKMVVFIRAHITYNSGIVMMLVSSGLILLAKRYYYLARPYRKPNPHVLMVESTEHRPHFDAPVTLNGPSIGRILA